LNDLIACAFTSAGIPSSKEPHGLVRSDGKRPDGLTLVPWKGGKPLAWNVTAVCTVADSYVAATAREAGAAVERAAELKISKYSGLDDSVSSSQLRWSQLVHSMRQLVNFKGSREKDLRPVR